MSEIKDLIQHALDQDYNKASEVFGQAMTIKTQEVLDQARIKLASEIYGGGEEYTGIDPVDVDGVEVDLSDEEIDGMVDATLEGDEDEHAEDEEEEVASEDEKDEEE